MAVWESRSVKSWATIVWMSKNAHWVVVELDGGAGSVFENEESELEVGEQLFADWTVYGGWEQGYHKSASFPFDAHIPSGCPSLQVVVTAAKKWAGED